MKFHKFTTGKAITRPAMTKMGKTDVTDKNTKNGPKSAEKCQERSLQIRDIDANLNQEMLLYKSRTC